MNIAITKPKLGKDSKAFLAKKKHMLIDGKWVEARSGKTFEVEDPATQEIIAHVPAGDKADIDLAVKAARKAFETGPWSRMSATQRGKLIWKLGDLLEANIEQFAMLETLDNGKPLAVARAADVPLAADLFDDVSRTQFAAGGSVGDDAGDDDWAAAEPAADGNTLEASAEADAIKVDVAVAAPVVVVPLAAPVVAVAAPVVAVAAPVV